MRVQAPRSPARGTSRPLPPSSPPAAAASSPGRAVSRGRTRRSAAGGGSVESRPGWNASTAVGREGRATRKRKGRRAEDVWRQAGRLDESFQFVRGLQLQVGEWVQGGREGEEDEEEEECISIKSIQFLGISLRTCQHPVSCVLTAFTLLVSSWLCVLT